MLGRAPLCFVLITLSVVSLVWLSSAAAPAGVRHAGTVLMGACAARWCRPSAACRVGVVWRLSRSDSSGHS